MRAAVLTYLKELVSFPESVDQTPTLLGEECLLHSRLRGLTAECFVLSRLFSFLTLSACKDLWLLTNISHNKTMHEDLGQGGCRSNTVGCI